MKAYGAKKEWSVSDILRKNQNNPKKSSRDNYIKKGERRNNKVRLVAIAASVLILMSCTKTKIETVTKTVTNTDTVKTAISHTVVVTTTVTVNDTLHVVAQNLVGEWKLYKIANVSNTIDTTFSTNTGWLYNFTNTQIQEDLNTGSWGYTYPITYGSNYVNIYYTSGVATLYNLTTVGFEYRLIQIQSATSCQIWYLKK